MVEPLSPWQILLVAPFGFLYLLLGYRAARFWIKVESAIVLAGLAVLASADALHWSVALVLAGLLALVGWKLGNLYYYLHVVFVGAILGAIVPALVFKSWELALGGAVVGTVLGILFQRPVVIAGTAAIGSLLLTTSAIATSALFGGSREWTWEAGVLWAVLTVLGTIYQCRTTRCAARPPAPSGP